MKNLNEIPAESLNKATHMIRLASANTPPEQAEWVGAIAYSEAEAQRIREGIELASRAFGLKYHLEVYRSEAVTDLPFNARQTVETLIGWLQGNIEMNNEIIFDNESADSGAMLPGLIEVLRIL